MGSESRAPTLEAKHAVRECKKDGEDKPGTMLCVYYYSIIGELF